MLTPSEMAPLGSDAPDFALPDTDGKLVRLADFADAPALLVCFLCAHCDYTTHIARALGAFADEYLPRGLRTVGINSNDESYASDAPGKMAGNARANGWNFPYLFDETQDVARAHRAACTPDLFLFDRARKLAYRGQFDDSRPGNGVPVTGSTLRAAADAVLANRPVEGEQRPSMGCNIKWRPNRAPDYFHPNLLERVLRRLRQVRLR